MGRGLTAAAITSPLERLRAARARGRGMPWRLVSLRLTRRVARTRKVAHAKLKRSRQPYRLALSSVYPSIAQRDTREQHAARAGRARPPPGSAPRRVCVILTSSTRSTFTRDVAETHHIRELGDGRLQRHVGQPMGDRWVEVRGGKTEAGVTITAISYRALRQCRIRQARSCCLACC